MKKYLNLFICVLFFTSAGAVLADKRMSRAEKKAALADVCPASKITQIGSTFFYKNNKPIRASSAINAPVIGNNPVITLAGQPGKGRGLFGGRGVLLASDGTPITSLTPYPCRADHCGGRVVSSMPTGTARRAAIKATRSPSGYVKIGGGLCVYIPDIGRGYGLGVNFGRPLCDRTVS